MRTSGYIERPDYRVEILRRRNRIRAMLGEVVLAESVRAIIVDEQDHGLVVYFPREDVAMERLVQIVGRTTHCPFKGDASYWATIDASAAPFAWSYEKPYPEVAAIAGHIAFYHETVTIILGAADAARF
jgi:uncharacterized protein (DUF427 family)